MERMLHQGIYDLAAMPVGGLKNGSRYVGFCCVICRSWIAVFENKYDVQRAVSVAGNRVFRLTCPFCQADRLYASDQIVDFRYEVDRRSEQAEEGSKALKKRRLFRASLVSKLFPPLK